MIWEETNFHELVGKTIIEIKHTKDVIYFYCDDGSEYRLFHEYECCELVEVDDICGDLDDLIGEIILVAEESCNQENPEGIVKKYQEKSFTWTFYKLATRKGYVTIRWYGESNGHYSESVRFEKVK